MKKPLRITANILCPGPSLAKWHPKDLLLSDIVIGVNRAIRYARCDWWVAADIPTIRNSPPPYSVRLFTTDDCVKKFAGELPKISLVGFGQADSFCPMTANRWAAFSACAALVLAAWRGANQIEVYGADWTDEPDYDGHRSADYNRSESRWAGERDIWERLSVWLFERGITVTRHGTAILS